MKFCVQCGAALNGKQLKYCSPSCHLQHRSEPDGDCRIWRGAKSNYGYGTLRVSGRGKSRNTHRLAYELYVGPLVAGKDVCHRCDRPACIEPKHLFLGTRKENMQDCKAKGRSRPNFKSHPPKGIQNGGAKLTDQMVREIRAAPKCTTALAKKYGINYAAAYKVRRRWTWTHVE